MSNVRKHYSFPPNVTFSDHQRNWRQQGHGHSSGRRGGYDNRSNRNNSGRRRQNNHHNDIFVPNTPEHREMAATNAVLAMYVYLLHLCMFLTRL